MYFFILILVSLAPFSIHCRTVAEESLDDVNVKEFSCNGKVLGRFYADVATNCRVFHACVMNSEGRTMDIPFACSNDTKFDQMTQQCHLDNLVSCNGQDIANDHGDNKLELLRRRKREDEGEDAELDGKELDNPEFELNDTVSLETPPMMYLPPKTNFSCMNRQMGRYYVDMEMDCKLFHICAMGVDGEILDFRFMCLDGTIFNQETRTCEESNKIKCGSNPMDPKIMMMMMKNVDEMKDKEEIKAIYDEEPEEEAETETPEETTTKKEKSRKNNRNSRPTKKPKPKEIDDYDDDKDASELIPVVVAPGFEVIRHRRQLFDQPAIEPPRYSYDDLPRTSFTCQGMVAGGYYADPETNCQLYHVCAPGGMAGVMIDFKFLCTNNTVFDQQTRTCMDFDAVDCANAVSFYGINSDLIPSSTEDERSTLLTTSPTVTPSTGPRKFNNDQKSKLQNTRKAPVKNPVGLFAPPLALPPQVTPTRPQNGGFSAQPIPVIRKAVPKGNSLDGNALFVSDFPVEAISNVGVDVVPGVIGSDSREFSPPSVGTFIPPEKPDNQFTPILSSSQIPIQQETQRHFQNPSPSTSFPFFPPRPQTSNDQFPAKEQSNFQPALPRLKSTFRPIGPVNVQPSRVQEPIENETQPPLPTTRRPFVPSKIIQQFPTETLPQRNQPVEPLPQRNQQQFPEEMFPQRNQQHFPVEALPQRNEQHFPEETFPQRNQHFPVEALPQRNEQRFPVEALPQRNQEQFQSPAARNPSPPVQRPQQQFKPQLPSKNKGVPFAPPPEVPVPKSEPQFQSQDYPDDAFPIDLGLREESLRIPEPQKLNPKSPKGKWSKSPPIKDLVVPPLTSDVSFGPKFNPVPAGSEFVDVWIQPSLEAKNRFVRQTSAANPALPTTAFTCRDKVSGGYYADIETYCQMFHVCARGSPNENFDFKFLCTNDTVFNQRSQTCEPEERVDCERSPMYFLRPEQLDKKQPVFDVPGGEIDGKEARGVDGDEIIDKAEEDVADRIRRDIDVDELDAGGEEEYIDEEDEESIAQTSFTCRGKKVGGYFADPETECRAFHICTRGYDGDVIDFMFFCANNTTFNQRSRICDEFDEVDCANVVDIDDQFFDVPKDNKKK